jgi:hypothetical protein
MIYALFDEKYPTGEYLEILAKNSNELEKRPDLYAYYLNNPLFTMKWYLYAVK